jgi:hypothetical protein
VLIGSKDEIPVEGVPSLNDLWDSKDFKQLKGNTKNKIFLLSMDRKIVFEFKF